MAKLFGVVLGGLLILAFTGMACGSNYGSMTTPVKYNQTITVAEGGAADYTSIQDAIDSIDDATLAANLIAHDDIQFRLRRLAAAGTEVDHEIIVLSAHGKIYSDAIGSSTKPE